MLACAVALPRALLGPAGTATDWLLIAYLGSVQVGLSYILLARGSRHVPALEASLLLLLEPVLNPLWVWLFQGERPGTATLGGGALILGASLLPALTGRAEREPFG